MSCSRWWRRYTGPHLAALPVVLITFAQDALAQTPTSASSLSSPSSTTSSVSTTSASSSSNGGSNTGEFTANSASYFFGFIITFVVLLVVFVGCGFGARRRGALFWDPRRGIVWEDPNSDKNERRRMERPVFWEVWGRRPLASGSAALEGRGGGPGKATEGEDRIVCERRSWREGTLTWGDMQPLSADFIRPPSPQPPPSVPPANSSAADEGRSPIMQHLRGAIFHRSPAPESRSRLFLRRKRPPPDPDPGQPPEAVRVAVLIAMPAPPKARAKSPLSPAEESPGSSNDEEELGLFQLGTAELPWSYGEVDAS